MGMCLPGLGQALEGPPPRLCATRLERGPKRCRRARLFRSARQSGPVNGNDRLGAISRPMMSVCPAS